MRTFSCLYLLQCRFYLITSGTFHTKCTLKILHLSDFLQILWRASFGYIMVTCKFWKRSGSLLGPFWADLRESLKKYPKSHKNSHNFPAALVPSIIILQLFFSYQNKDLSLFYLMNFEILQKKFFLGAVQGVQFFWSF